MPNRDVVVIGASAGGVSALTRLVADLPAGLPASVLIVVHTTSSSAGHLPEVLARLGPLPAAHAEHGQPLTRGLLTVAPPGQHLIVTSGDALRLHRGPVVHRTRPAIDPLMHSAARVCGARVIAVVLSGMLRDGADGAASVAAAGGVVVVQDPADAACPDMPTAALEATPEAAVWPAARLGPAIAELVVTPVAGPDAELMESRLPPQRASSDPPTAQWRLSRLFAMPELVALRIDGEIDISAAVPLGSRLESETRRPGATTDVVLDIAEVTLLTAAGCRALARFADHLTLAGRRMVLVTGTGAARLILETFQGTHGLQMVDTMDGALRMLGAVLPRTDWRGDAYPKR